jgi:hypothetical protein
MFSHKILSFVDCDMLLHFIGGSIGHSLNGFNENNLADLHNNSDSDSETGDSINYFEQMDSTVEIPSHTDEEEIDDEDEEQDNNHSNSEGTSASGTDMEQEEDDDIGYESL